jgi:hypothetical protein
MSYKEWFIFEIIKTSSYNELTLSEKDSFGKRNDVSNYGECFRKEIT